MYNYPGKRFFNEFEVLELMGMDFQEVEHCDSCHSDDEEGYADMIEYDVPEFGKGCYAHLCCKVGKLYEKWHNKGE